MSDTNEQGKEMEAALIHEVGKWDAEMQGFPTEVRDAQLADIVRRREAQFIRLVQHIHHRFFRDSGDGGFLAFVHPWRDSALRWTV